MLKLKHVFYSHLRYYIFYLELLYKTIINLFFSNKLVKDIENIQRFSKLNKSFLTKNLDIPSYYINLNRHKERNGIIKEIINNYNLTNLKRIEAVSCLNIKNETFNFFNGRVFNIKTGKLKKRYTETELPHTISHFIAIKTAYERGNVYALIMEDDTLLESFSLSNKKITTLIGDAPKDWGVLRLCNSQNKEGYILATEDSKIQAYIIERETMSELISLFKNDTLHIQDLEENDNIYLHNKYIYSFISKPVYTVPFTIIKNTAKFGKPLDRFFGAFYGLKNSIIKKNMVNVRDKGYFNPGFGGDLLYKIVSHYKGTKALCTTKRKNEIIIHSKFDFQKGQIDIRNIWPQIKFNNHIQKLISWSGEPERVKTDKAATVNLLSQKPERKNDIWVPFVLSNISEEKINILKEKRFRKINDRPFFLAYVSSKCIKERQAMFKEILSIRKDAHALGKCLNNRKPDIKRYDYTSNNLIFQKYRFVLCMENCQKKGYITEKILNAFLGGAIPIYWGCDESVEMFFNKNAFININNFSSFKECARYVYAN